MSEAYGVVGISDIEVERHAPHDDQPHVDLHQLPGDGATRAHHGVGVLHHHHLSISWEHIPWRKKSASFTTFCVCFYVKECEHGPVGQAEDAPHARTSSSSVHLDFSHSGVVQG